MSSRSTKAEEWKRTFRNILDLERANGFNDRAVIGGMDGFVRLWTEAMAAYVGSTLAEREQLRPGYAKMDASKRAEWVEFWLAALVRGTLAKGPEQTATEKAADRRPRSARTTLSGVRPADDKLPAITLDSPLSELRRLNAKTAGQLARLKVSTVRDLLYYFPYRYIDYSRKAKISELWPGQELTIVGQISESKELTLGRSRRKATEAVLTDDTGSVRITWFGQGFLARTLKPGTNLAVSGRVEGFKNRPVFESPDYDILRPGQEAISTGRLVPVYPLTAGLTGRALRGLTWRVLKDFSSLVEETAPEEMLARTSLPPLAIALRQAHYPDSLRSRDQARRRLAFDELLTLQLSVLTRRQREVGLLEGVPVNAEPDALEGFLSGLSFQLTTAQRRCLEEILADMRRGTPPMNRLLQGEVGSGKTVVALVALLAAISRGYQGAIMVPTEVLAEQHFLTVDSLLSGMVDTTHSENLLTAYLESLGRPVTVGLLTGSTRSRPRNRIRALAAEGTLDLLIGTHALIQEGVEMPRLALAIMDEQHRFGVVQRSALRQKSEENPHTLVMSATPIPRTLTLTLYGDLDISVIDELPPGRQDIQTRCVDPQRREAAYGFIRREIKEGRQAFIVCPLVEESELIETKAASDEYQRLSKEVFPELKVGLLHGRMPGTEKDKIMRQFREGGLDILVTTAVVEVGIDVPNATVMLIEGADRFGLSQLHQFRGRVGRGEHRSYCILMSDNPSNLAQERLSALERTRDGFELAEIDLNLRGPGDFFGTRQSGLPSLRMAQLSDRDLLDLARQEAMRIMEEDPYLEGASHAALAAQVARFMEQVSAEMS